MITPQRTVDRAGLNYAQGKGRPCNMSGRGWCRLLARDMLNVRSIFLRFKSLHPTPVKYLRYCGLLETLYAIYYYASSLCSGKASACGMDAKIRLVQFETADSAQRVGVQLGDEGSVVDVCASEPSLPRDMRSFLQHWDSNVRLAAK